MEAPRPDRSMHKKMLVIFLIEDADYSTYAIVLNPTDIAHRVFLQHLLRRFTEALSEVRDGLFHCGEMFDFENVISFCISACIINIGIRACIQDRERTFVAYGRVIFPGVLSLETKHSAIQLRV